jgi:hypothetical protein
MINGLGGIRTLPHVEIPPAKHPHLPSINLYSFISNICGWVIAKKLLEVNNACILVEKLCRNHLQKSIKKTSSSIAKVSTWTLLNVPSRFEFELSPYTYQHTHNILDTTPSRLVYSTQHHTLYKPRHPHRSRSPRPHRRHGT